jgi:3-oxoacyl-[acyl-carrier-protein] synthase-3
MYSRITGTGSYLPEKILTNRELEQSVDTSHDWVVARTGIAQRHIAADSETCSDLALNASREALAAAGLEANEIGLIVVATTTPDMIFPSTASILQGKLGIDNGCPAFDIQAVCGGFVYALATADLFVRAGKCAHALVIGSEIYSRILDWNDRTTCVLFGDGAGAVVLSASESPGILAHKLHADGRHTSKLSVPGTVAAGAVTGHPFVVMEGQAVFKFAVRALADIVEETLAEAGLARSQLDWLVPHQANIRIIESTAKHLGLPMAKVIVTVDQHANTSAASIPLALDVGVRDGRVRPGQHVLLEGIGGGFTWGAVLVRW